MKIRLPQATAPRKGKKLPRKGKKLTASQKFRKFLRVKLLLIIAFVLIFAAAGTAMLLRSRAATLVGSWCNGSSPIWPEIPGGGLALSSPTVTQVNNVIYYPIEGWKMIVVARGLDNAVWFTSMDSKTLKWRNEWKSLGGQTYWPPKIINTRYSGFLTTGTIIALGTDGNSYKIETTGKGWGSWEYLEAGPNRYYGTGNYTTEYPSTYTYNVRTIDKHLQYRCY
jgi:hypothetical protein